MQLSALLASWLCRIGTIFATSSPRGAPGLPPKKQVCPATATTAGFQAFDEKRSRYWRE